MVLLLLACRPDADPHWVAMQTCIAMPGLTMDGASQALAADAIVADELQIWHDDASYGTEGYGPVYEELGLEGVGVLRANSLCGVESVTATEATIVRQEPDLDAITTWKIKQVWELPLVERRHTFTLEGVEDGYRARMGLRTLRARALSTELLVAQDRHDKAIEEYRELHAEFPDPRILWRIRQVERKSVDGE